MNWPRILGGVMVLYAVFVIYRGRISSSDDYGHSSSISRAEKPIQFWFSVLIMLAIAVTLLFNLIHL